MKSLLVVIVVIFSMHQDARAFVISKDKTQELVVDNYTLNLCKSELLELSHELKSQSFEVFITAKCKKVTAINPEGFTFQGSLKYGHSAILQMFEVIKLDENGHFIYQ